MTTQLVKVRMEHSAGRVITIRVIKDTFSILSSIAQQSMGTGHSIQFTSLLINAYLHLSGEPSPTSSLALAQKKEESLE